MLTITDSWAWDVSVAALLLRTVAEEAAGLGFEWIRLNCRRDDVLARLAVLAGGELRWCAAQERDCTEKGEDVDAFYVADLRLAIEQLLPELNARWKRCAVDAPARVLLSTENEEVILGLGCELTMLGKAAGDVPRARLARKAMTQAIMGYASPTELALIHEGCDIPAACRDVIDVLFEAREPHLIHEGYAFAKASEFGLVP